MTEEKMNEMAAYYEKEESIHPGLALVVVMLDEIIHTDEHPYCDDPTCPCHEEQEEDPESDMEARLARQAAQHLEDRGYFDMWGCHDSDESWYLSRPNQSDWLVE